MDSIIWAFRHTERNVAETGLNLLLDMLTNFQVLFFYCWCVLCKWVFPPTLVILEEFYFIKENLVLRIDWLHW